MQTVSSYILIKSLKTTKIKCEFASERKSLKSWLVCAPLRVAQTVSCLNFYNRYRQFWIFCLAQLSKIQRFTYFFRDSSQICSLDICGRMAVVVMKLEKTFMKHLRFDSFHDNFKWFSVVVNLNLFMDVGSFTRFFPSWIEWIFSFKILFCKVSCLLLISYWNKKLLKSLKANILFW